MQGKKKVRFMYCPRCRSSSIDPHLVAITGAYYCKKCGYSGSLVIEMDK